MPAAVEWRRMPSGNALARLTSRWGAEPWEIAPPPPPPCSRRGCPPLLCPHPHLHRPVQPGRARPRMTHEAWRRTSPAPTAGPRSPPPPPLIRYAERVPAGAPSVRLALATGGPRGRAGHRLRPTGLRRSEGCGGARGWWRGGRGLVLWPSARVCGCRGRGRGVQRRARGWSGARHCTLGSIRRRQLPATRDNCSSLVCGVVPLRSTLSHTGLSWCAWAPLGQDTACRSGLGGRGGAAGH